MPPRQRSNEELRAIHTKSGGKEYRQDFGQNPKVVVREKMNGTTITYEEPEYVGYVISPSGKKIPRYMNKSEAERWSEETGNKIERI